MISTEELSEVFVEVADTLVADFDIVEFLHNLAARTTLVSGADAAGLLLTDQNDRLRFVASSSERATLLELFQLQNQEGPCLDCFRSRAAVTTPDLKDALQRWPLFAPRALEAGFRSVHAIPMRLHNQVIGALNLFSETTIRLTEADTRIVQALADVATIGILQERAVARAETLSEQLAGALNSRIVIEQAKGAIAQARSISVDMAFDILRDYARGNGQRLSDVARRVLTNPRDLPGLLDSSTG